jgi:hypothetical protein
MNVRRAFKAKVLAYAGNEYVSEVLTFGEDDSPKAIDLGDPFVCLTFVEQQVRKRTSMNGIEDFEVTMNVLTHDRSGITTEDIVVRPWRFPKSVELYKKA